MSGATYIPEPFTVLMEEGEWIKRIGSTFFFGMEKHLEQNADSVSLTDRKNRNIKPIVRICVIGPETSPLKDIENLICGMGAEALCIDHVIGASNKIRDFGPDILVVDVNMPTLSGEKLIRVLKSNLDEFPLLMLYSRLAPKVLEKMASSVGADDYVVETGDYLELANRLKYHMNRLSKNP